MGNRGFSLLELIAVLVILAILAAVGIPAYLKHVESARAADAQVSIGAIKTAYKMYYQKYGRAPRDVQELLDKKILELDQATQNQWKFSFRSGEEGKVAIIEAVSTEAMSAGGGKTIKYDAATGGFSGYGQ
jgi:prepilin-type N-terminal cleavage/methylation domain-containing protein